MKYPVHLLAIAIALLCWAHQVSSEDGIAIPEVPNNQTERKYESMEKKLDRIAAMMEMLISGSPELPKHADRHQEENLEQIIYRIDDRMSDLHNYVFGDVDNQALISGKRYYVQDGGLTASTSYDSRHGTQCSRLGAVKPSSCHSNAWHGTAADTKPWIQADLGRTFDIHAVATQGRSGVDQWVLTYHIASLHGSKFLYFLDKLHGGIKDFRGNFDQDSVIRNPFVPSIQTRVLRLYPVTWKGYCAIRWEIYGKPAL